MRNLFRDLGLVRDTQGHRRKQRKTTPDARGNGISPERLEPRMLLAVDVFASTPLDGRENWVNVTVDSGDDAFIQHVGNSDRDMFVANNSSFVGAEEVPNFLSTYDSLNIFEGENIVKSGVRPQGAPYQDTAAQDTFSFFINRELFDAGEEISGVLLIGSQRFDFSNGGEGTTFSSPQLTGPITGALTFNYDGQIRTDTNNIVTIGMVTRLQLSHPNFRGLAPETDVRIEQLNIDNDYLDPEFDIFGDLVDQNEFRDILINIPAASTDGTRLIQAFDPAVWSAGLYIPGSLRGSLSLELLGLSQSVPFQVDTTGVSIDDPNLGRTRLPIAFEDVFSPGVERTLDLRLGVSGFASAGDGSLITNTRDVGLTGTFDSISGEVQFETALYVSGENQPLEMGAALIVDELEVGLYTPAAVPVPSNATIFPGLTHTNGLKISLPTPGSRVRIDSPVITTGATFGQGDIFLASSDISINSPVFATETFVVPSAGNSYFGTTSERMVVNAPVSSDSFTVQLADSAATAEIPRSQLRVTQSGSLSNTGNLLAGTPANLTEATSTFVEVVDGDIFIEGSVVSGVQSYVMSSSVGSEEEAPFFLTTRSKLTGVDIGEIRGDTLSLTLGNDTLGENFLSLAKSEVTLSTDVTRLRTQASSRSGDPLEEMFPYVMTITEADDLLVDAVAGSSDTLSITAGGGLNLLGAIRSQADVVLESSADFQVSAPITTSFGSIIMRGPNVTVDSAVRVLDSVQDERLTDILIESTDQNGGMLLNDAISGLNRVQLNSAGDVSGNARVRADIIDVNAQGNVAFSTAANLVTVDAAGTVRVEDEGPVAFEVRESNDVTLVSMGKDRLVDHDNDPTTPDQLSPTLYADVFDTTQLVTSAPNGSVDVLHHGSQSLELGDIEEINAGVVVAEGSAGMLAAGSSVIRSTLSPQITVRDFPAALSSANEVRIATTAPLPAGASYTPGPGEPGTYPTILRVNLFYETEDLNENGILDPAEEGDNNGNGSVDQGETGDLNGNDVFDPNEDRNNNGVLDVGLKRLPVLDNVYASQMRVGDKILIKDGKYQDTRSELYQDAQYVDQSVNGIYVVLGINYISYRAVEFTLARSTQFDESSELRDRHYVTVTGVADPNNNVSDANTLAGRSFASRPFENVSPFEFNVPFENPDLPGSGVLATPFEVNRVPSRPGYVVARAATSQVILTEAAFIEPSLEEFDEGYEDRNGNGVLDTEDLNGNRMLDPGEDRPNGVLDNEDTNGNDILDAGEDQNGNGVLDDEDTNDNGVLDAGEDALNGVLDTEDTNGNQKLDPKRWVDQIKASSAGFIDQDAALFNGVALEKNDIVLVREPVAKSIGGETQGAPTEAAIGLYIVSDVGSAVNPWVLERYEGIDEDGDGSIDQVLEGVVTVHEGTLRTALTGEMFDLSYKALHISALPYDELTDYRETLSNALQPNNPSVYVVDQIENFDSVVEFRTDVGTSNPNGTVNFEVSTEGGTNTAPGSLGRMLNVLQSNSAYVTRTGDRQPYSTTFSDDVTNIVLEQQLPTISTPVSLEPSSLVSIDGSEITLTRDGAVVPTGTITAAIGPVRPSQERTIRRLVRSSEVGDSFLNGIELKPSAEGSVISNLQIGGFNTGAAIFIGGAGNVLVDNVILGRDINGPLPNRYGIEIQNVMADDPGSVAGTEYTTISNSQIYSSSDSGIYLGTNTNNVRVVDGNVIGAVNQGNAVGLKIDSVAGRIIVGAAPIVEPVAGVQAVARSTKMFLPLLDEDGNQQFNPDDLFLGQVLTSLDGSSIATGTAIAAIEERYAEDDPADLIGIELTLSEELTNTANISVTLSPPDARNAIQYNSDGVVLESGSSRMVMTDVTRSVFDGIVINGVGTSKLTPTGQHQIGGVEYAGVTSENIQNLSNNSIHSNGLAGIVFKDAFFSQLATIDTKLAMAGRVKIQGNYLGSDTNQSSGLTNGRDGASNIVVQQAFDELGTTDEHEEIRKRLLADATPSDSDPRDGGLYYSAPYRAEDNLNSDPNLASRDGLDQEGNYHVAGDPISGGPNPVDPTDPEDPRGPPRPPVMR